MNELSRHIEILLLDNDCVIVPGFGGFMAHYAPACYVEESGIFYPPLRSLGFNAQLQLNDSLLAQSYVEAYDISYPEAVRRIESEVEEIRQIITMEGCYEFHGIGVITLLSDGRYDFQPCLAGVLSPNLYALDSFQMDMLESEEESPSCIIPLETEENEQGDGIRISYAMMRNVLAAALLAFFIVFSCIPLGIGSDNVQRCSMIDTELISSIIPQPVETVKAPTPKVEEHYFAIVLASRVSKSGAEEFVTQLKAKGMADASVYQHGSSRKVIYGRYHSEKEAIEALSKLRSDSKDFTQAWTMEIKS